MRTKALSTLIALSFAAGSIGHAGLKEVIGQVAGGIFAGALCNEIGIGKGNGRTAAIALCALGGSMIGGEIGKDMDDADARAFEASQIRSFDGELNHDYDWDGRSYGSHTGIHGRMRPIRQGYHRNTREVCREYQSTTYRGNRSSQTRSIVCRRSDGSFYSLKEKTLFINGRVVEHETHERTNRNQPPYITPDRRHVPRPAPYPDDEYGRHDRRDNRQRACIGWDINQVRYGNEVYSRYGQAGIFQGLNGSGREAAIRVNNFNQIVSLTDLAIPGCHFGITTGQTVATRYGQQGTLAGIFANGDVAVRVSSFIQVLQKDDIYFR